MRFQIRYGVLLLVFLVLTGGLRQFVVTLHHASDSAVAALGRASASRSASSGTSQVPVSHCDWRTGRDCPAVPSSCHFRHAANGAALPDRRCTPGARNRAVTPTTVPRTICVSGYSKTVRPPTSYTGPLKNQIMRAYGLDPSTRSEYELDHLVALEDGGAAGDVRNLFPEAYHPPGARQKDTVENTVHDMVCRDPGRLRALQRVMARDWTAIR